MSRALLALDVDGPLNPSAAKPHRRPAGYQTHRWTRAPWTPRRSLRVWLHPGHGELLLAFAARYDVELAWATLWEEEANEWIGPKVGLPELPVIHFGYHPDRVVPPGWKYPAMTAYAAGRALIWFDDEFGLRSQAQRRAVFERDRRGTPTLLHHIDPRVGLVDDDLAVAGAWLDREVPPIDEGVSP